MAVATFLDRDGVLNEARVVDGMAASPHTVAELRVAEGAADAVDRLRRAGYVTVVVSNQPEVARGTVTRAAVDEMNDELRSRLGFDAVYVCTHDQRDDCDCRKPKPGMLKHAARDFDLSLSHSWIIGDRWVDIAAGDAAGVGTVLLDRDYSWNRTSAGVPSLELSPRYRSTILRECVDFVVSKGGGGTMKFGID